MHASPKGRLRCVSRRGGWLTAAAAALAAAPSVDRPTRPRIDPHIIRNFPQATDDYRLDAQLYGSCKDAVKELCANVDPGEGRELECLVRGWC